MTDVIPDYLGTWGIAARAAIIVLLLIGLWIGLTRAGIAGRARLVTWLAVALPLFAWLAIILRLVSMGAFSPQPEVGSPLIPLVVLLPLILGLTLLMRSLRIAAAVDATPPSWLIGLQVYRVVGGVFLIAWMDGYVPGEFALSAGSGDVLTGLLAIPAALYLHVGGRGSRAAAYAWNAFGILDLIAALTLGFLSSPGPMQTLALDHPNMLTASPLVVIPAFAVPLSLILHGISIWQLRRRNERSTTHWTARAA